MFIVLRAVAYEVLVQLYRKKTAIRLLIYQ